MSSDGAHQTLLADDVAGALRQNASARPEMGGAGGAVRSSGSSSVRSAAYWLTGCAVDWLVIAAALWLVCVYPWCAPLSVFVIATRQHALGIQGHEGAHRAICRNRKLNDALACLFCWWPLGIDINAYRRFHFAHHQLLGSKYDPEEIHRQELSPWQWRDVTMPKRVFLFFADHLGLGLWEVATAIRVIGKPVGIGWMAPVVAVSSALLFWFCWPLGLLWHLSLVTSFWAVGRLRMYTEHYGSGDDLTHPTVKPALWKRAIYLPHGTWKHREHHSRPGLRQWELDVGT